MNEKKFPFTEPVPLKANDPRLRINGRPVEVACRIISEENYQILKEAFDDLNKALPEVVSIFKEAIGLMEKRLNELNKGVKHD